MSDTIKGFFFSQIDTGGIGPRQKVNNQIKAFAKRGIDLQLVESPFKLDGPIRGNFVLRQIICRLPFTYVYSKHQYKKEFVNADVYYVRFLAGDIHFVRFLKRLKMNNPSAQLVMELADYPTTWYMTTSALYKVLYFPIILKDIFARRQYRKYVDRIALIKNYDNVYGIKTLKFENGIDVDGIRVKRECGTNEIKIIAVAGMCIFHGYDRLIEGLRIYYENGGDRDIEVHMVGGKDEPGNDLSSYISLVKQYGLEKRVFFYGTKQGAELDDIYDKCNIAVASLGMYRIGYTIANSLKVREYLAKGLPVVTGCNTDIFSRSSFDYECRFPNDDSPIDIDKLVNFFDMVYINRNEQKVISSIREYAKDNCDFCNTMEPVIEYIKNAVR